MESDTGRESTGWGNSLWTESFPLVFPSMWGIKSLSFNRAPFGKIPTGTFHNSACVSKFPIRYLVRTLRHRVYTPLLSFIDIIHAWCVLSPHRWRGGWCIFFPLLLFMNESVSHVVMLWVPCWSLTNLPTTRTLSLAREYKTWCNTTLGPDHIDHFPVVRFDVFFTSCDATFEPSWWPWCRFCFRWIRHFEVLALTSDSFIFWYLF